MANVDWDAAIQEQEKKVKNLGIGDEAPPPAYPAAPSPAATPAATPAASQAQSATAPAPAAAPASAAGGVEKEDDAKEAADASLLNKALHSRLIQHTSTSQLEVQQKDPNSPLHSVKSFEELRLKQALLKGVYEMGFNAPSKIQETALPLLMADPPKNMIAQSQSGTGKTAAFVLTMLSRVDNNHYPQALCLAPTYELAIQIGKVVEEMGKNLPDINVRYAVRGQRVQRGEKVNQQIIIGTPGTTLDWCLKLRSIDLSRMKVFCLDEADVMIATQGHQDQSIRIQKKLPSACQMMLFSATYDNTVMKFATTVVPDPVVIRLRREEESLSNIKQYYVLCSNKEEKAESLSNIYGTITIGQAMIFCQTKRNANWLAERMTREGHAVALLSGDLTVEQRVAVLERYRAGKEKILITTNVMARGIDIEQVTVVVNFDLPVDMNGQADCETYLHRIGRTGRFGKSGLAINFVDGPRSMDIMKIIENHFGRQIERLYTDDAEEIEKIV
ncbi:ATP-dependent RNA helicase DDX19A [Strongylocentrotus purpuratus]|uniref:RNA helicase n=1 Tax=Strongylocentrotus purpuratus TaxID=7668 RepID=A0A7M7NXE9_STRPU|nr:ATP-dependent RNA helicase DDX19A [Strongylocentrotus purpuratus]|eukprot:XP_003728878.1 PREDICTED: ATP-dependent RNA helicase DDX19A isoform X2 [Strongylocentrotus purpuratus]